MAQIKPLVRTTTIGDAAVDGLLNGVVAGLVMAAYLMLVTLMQGQAPWSVLAAFDPTNQGGLAIGLVMHLAVSGVYGAIFGLVWKTVRGARVPLPGWIAGLFFGLLLFAIAELVLLPGATTGLRGIPALHFGIAHLLYGVALGSLMARLNF